jgi:hypothetical protein
MTNEIMATVPISDRLPLVEWIQEYHAFRVRFELELYYTGFTAQELHRDRLGSEASPGVWVGKGYAVVVATKSVSFEVDENFTLDEVLATFHAYQEQLFPSR